MKKLLNLKKSNINLQIIRIVLFISIFIIVFCQESFAISASDCSYTNQSATYPKSHDASRGVCEVNPEKCGFQDCAFNPKLEVVYKNGLSFLSTPIGPKRQTLGISECKKVGFLGDDAIRVCARIAQPGKFGNVTNLSQNPRPQLCAYEDPWDGMDTNMKKSPYHYMTPNTDAKSLEAASAEGAVFGAAAGTFIPGVGTIAGAALGSAISTLTAAIQANYNLDVTIGKGATDTLGCVDIPMYALAGTFYNDRWFEGSPPPEPFVEVDSTSTFFEPKVKAYVCRDSQGGNNIIPCKKNDAGNFINKKNVVIDNNYISQAIITLTTDNSPEKTVCVDSPALSNNAQNSGSNSRNSLDDRKFCLSIDSQEPDTMNFYTTSVYFSARTIPQILNRPNYITKPEIVTNSSTGKIQVCFSNSPGTAASNDADYLSSRNCTEFLTNPLMVRADNQATNPSCGVINQVKFCLSPKCRNAPNITAADCTANNVCVSGYSPLIVTNTVDDSQVKDASVTVRYPTTDATGGDFLYKKPKDSESPNKVVIEQNANYRLRSAKPEEVNMCKVLLDPNVPIFTASPVEYTAARPNSATSSITDRFMTIAENVKQFTVPEHCTQLKVKLWGGGSAGSSRRGTDTRDTPGAPGGIVNAFVDVTPGQKYTAVVGRGSNINYSSNDRFYGENSFFYKSSTTDLSNIPADELNLEQILYLARPLQLKMNPSTFPDGFSRNISSVFEYAQPKSLDYMYGMDQNQCTHDAINGINFWGCLATSTSDFNDQNSDTYKIRMQNRSTLVAIHNKKVLAAGGGMGGTLSDPDRNDVFDYFIDQNLPGMRILGEWSNLTENTICTNNYGTDERYRLNSFDYTRGIFDCNSSFRDSVYIDPPYQESTYKFYTRYEDDGNFDFAPGPRGGVDNEAACSAIDPGLANAPKGGLIPGTTNKYYSHGAGGCAVNHDGNYNTGNGLPGRIEIYCSRSE